MDNGQGLPTCAVIWDLDGVITRTADTHARAWKATFDPFLRAWSERHGPQLAPFALPDDYLEHVDGKPRLDGVRDFLATRGIALPEGSGTDGSQDWTIHGLGKAKNARFRELVENEGVQLYDSTLALIRSLRGYGVSQAVVSSSKNCRYILERCDLLDRFETVVDGNDIEQRGLAGKPSPDLFTEAAKRLKCNPAEAVVVEDAVSGVKAGREGRFGLVIGVDRGGNREMLSTSGADRVVSDLDELKVDDLLKR
ncbi:HAD family hydrolase [Thiohalomonas denitrificans]|uniref:Haloacid dehalogenase superfamily, subfamily IA, variant 3 with third motif having DD or ED/beta-phosphoglucomutase family hydrolase n=1 Tax=Thiohalomonas denitrificans TaxID=415747 RepID=A0A1G5Q3X4_9GAMM|nr:HAD-IA family hydrolase [Thiohalomonas denitrificans]SCZ56160.1 haloacid dehalogenase superfamily, subfamily IA, variant 3 with third motif having DD or ED/beta-phosphoglucomutase family hydrolase [Thiohalomonas denitrificans]